MNMKDPKRGCFRFHVSSRDGSGRESCGCMFFALNRCDETGTDMVELRRKKRAKRVAIQREGLIKMLQSGWGRGISPAAGGGQDGVTPASGLRSGWNRPRFHLEPSSPQHVPTRTAHATKLYRTEQ